MLQENNPDATCMSISRTYVPGILLYLPCVSICVCLEACGYRALVSRMTNRHGHWVYWMSTGGKSSLNTASSSVKHVVEVAAERRLVLATPVTPIFPDQK